MTQLETAPMDVWSRASLFRRGAGVRRRAAHDHRIRQRVGLDRRRLPGADDGNPPPWGRVGYTYTELYDIEHELAGLAHYDRSPKEIGYDLTMVNSADFVGWTSAGILSRGPAHPSKCPCSSALWTAALSSAVEDWRWSASPPSLGNAAGRQLRHARADAHGVTELTPLTLTLPESRGSVRCGSRFGTPTERCALAVARSGRLLARSDFDSGCAALLSQSGATPLSMLSRPPSSAAEREIGLALN